MGAVAERVIASKLPQGWKHSDVLEEAWPPGVKAEPCLGREDAYPNCSSAPARSKACSESHRGFP